MTDPTPPVAGPTAALTGRRDAVREALIDALTLIDTPADYGDPPPTGPRLGTRDPGDATVALLDAWATVGDIVSFYTDRIRTEAYLTTATEPGSVLAVAELVGVHPRPGVAASGWLAFVLDPDPADTAVTLPAGQTCQTTAGPGEVPQTFETTDELVARPSWNRLPARAGAMLTVQDIGAESFELVVRGAATGIAANQVVLVDTGDQDASPLIARVVAVEPDVVAGRTSLRLLRHPTRATPPPRATTASPDQILSAVDVLLDPLGRVPPSPPSLQDLHRLPQTVLAQTDLAVRVVGLLRPGVGQELFQALATTPIGAASLTGAAVLKSRGAPFAALVAARQVFDRTGRLLGTEDVPVAPQTLGLRLRSADRGADAAPLLAAAVRTASGVEAEVFVDEPGGSGRAPLQLTGTLGVPAGAGLPGSLEVSPTDGGLDVVYKAVDEADDFALTIAQAQPAEQTPGPGGVVEIGAQGLQQPLTLTFTDDGSHIDWLPRAGSELRAVVGRHRVSIEWSPTAPTTDVTITLERLRPPPQTVLVLDAVYDAIVPGSRILVERAGSGATAAGGVTYPVARQVLEADAVVVTQFGLSQRATRLVLDGPWVGDDVLWVSQLRDVIVRFASADLDLLPSPLTDDIAGNQLPLDGLYPGLQPGRLLIVQGERGDLPAGASTVAAEPVTVAGATIRADSPGMPPYTVLVLAAPLSFNYRRSTVVVFGNVTAVHQGSTIVEHPAELGADPKHPTFTLAQAPVLADPDTSAEGARLALTVRVDGKTWTKADRLDDTHPADRYLLGTDGQGRTVVTLGATVPAAADIEVTYRAGFGRAGNVRAGQLNQLMSSPQSVASATNPLPTTGGSNGDGPETVRARVPLGLGALGHVVSIVDHADLALSFAGIDKASAALVSDGARQVVAVTIAGPDPQPLDRNGALVTAVRGALQAAGGGRAPVVVLPAAPSLIVVTARVARDPAWTWQSIADRLQAALIAAFGYDRRALGQDVIVSDLVAVAHGVTGVTSFTVTGLGLVRVTASSSDVAKLLKELPAPPADGRLAVAHDPDGAPADGTPPAATDPTRADGPPWPTGLAYLPGDVPEAVLLQEAT